MWALRVPARDLEIPMPSEPGRHAFEGMFGGGVVNFLNVFLVV